MNKAVQQLKQVTNKIVQGGNAEARERHTSKNKLLARERVDKLIDPQSVATCFISTKLTSFFFRCFLFLKNTIPRTITTSSLSAVWQRRSSSSWSHNWNRTSRRVR